MPSGIPTGSAPFPAGTTNDSLKELVMRLLETMKPLDLGEYEGFHYSHTSRTTRLISLQFTKGTFTPLEIATKLGWRFGEDIYQVPAVVMDLAAGLTCEAITQRDANRS